MIGHAAESRSDELRVGWPTGLPEVGHEKPSAFGGPQPSLPAGFQVSCMPGHRPCLMRVGTTLTKDAVAVIYQDGPMPIPDEVWNDLIETTPGEMKNRALVTRWASDSAVEELIAAGHLRAESNRVTRTKTESHA